MREQIWTGILEADRLGRYYGMVSDKYSRWHLFLTCVVVVSASSSAASLLARLPEAIAAVALVIASAVAIWLYLKDYSGKAVAARLFSEQYDHLATEWRRLWYSDSTPEEIYALRRASDRIGAGYDIPIDKDLHARAQEDSYATIPAEFAHSGGLEAQA